MNDLISRKDALDEVDILEFHFSHHDIIPRFCELLKAGIKGLPTIEQPAQKHGRWLDGICTNCGVEALEYVDEEGDWLVYTTDYCPNCGAKMDGE